MHTIFGPIQSRRFGRSLGVDLSPEKKQCNFDCLYCELAPMATVEKQERVVEVATVIEELKEHLSDQIDVITITANGEPTLYPYLDQLIAEIDKIKGSTETLILTNSAALIDPKVYKTLLKFDQVKLSLDAVSEDIFKKIDRPHKSIKLEKLVERVISFSQEYSKKLYIEVLFVRGLNDTQEAVVKLNEVLKKVRATRIDLGTIDRPPAYPVEGLSYKELHTIAMLFDKTLPIHIASRVHAEPNQSEYSREEILNTLDKRPLTREDIDLLFNEASKQRLAELLEKQELVEKNISNVVFLVPKENVKRKRK